MPIQRLSHIRPPSLLQRIKMYAPRPGEPEAEGEFAPYKVNEPLGSFMLGEVVDSKADGLKPGDCVTTVGPWQRYAVAQGAACNKVPRDVSGSPAVSHDDK
jgi:NADPH-dependent curcumin reductase CurA